MVQIELNRLPRIVNPKCSSADGRKDVKELGEGVIFGKCSCTDS